MIPFSPLTWVIPFDSIPDISRLLTMVFWNTVMSRPRFFKTEKLNRIRSNLECLRMKLLCSCLRLRSSFLAQRQFLVYSPVPFVTTTCVRPSSMVEQIFCQRIWSTAHETAACGTVRKRFH